MSLLTSRSERRSVGVWCPGQEVKLAFLVLIFSHKIFKMEDSKQISVIFKSDKKKRSPQFIFIHIQITWARTKLNIYPFLQERITNSELLSDLWPICTKWLIYYYFFFLSGRFQRPPKVAPGTRAPLAPLATPLEDHLQDNC